MAVTRSSSDRVTKSQGKGAILGVFLPTDNALYSILFRTPTKTAELIEMPFGMMTRVGRRYHVLDGGPDFPKGMGHFGGCPGHSKALAIFAAAVAAAFASKEIIQSPVTLCSRRNHSVCQGSANRNPENSERRRHGLSAGKGVIGEHSAGEV